MTNLITLHTKKFDSKTLKIEEFLDKKTFLWKKDFNDKEQITTITVVLEENSNLREFLDHWYNVYSTDSKEI
jgi:hypothetical protein